MPTSPSRRFPRLLITMGDPAGIGPEVLLKSLPRIPARFPVTVIGDIGWLRKTAGRLRFSVPWSRFEWLDLQNVPGRFSPGRVQPAAGRAAVGYLRMAIDLLKRGRAAGIVTGPVSKEAIVMAGIPWIGHTEFLARSFRRKTVMMFVTGRFRVSLATTHVSMRRLPGRLNRDLLRATVRLTLQALRRDFGIRRPTVGLAALNPHAGEGGLFGREESRLLKPVVRSFRTAVGGPTPADSLMRQAADGRYDAVVALYHDQALIPVKLLGWEQAVNVTLGLPFVRTSPVHGTGFEIAGRGKADPSSMIAAIRLAQHLIRQRSRLH
ncbi:MAG: 4-hydroxythreonine-4-phosphate dehydrogenase PdxA [Candidatus Omnitrophica bacterium]|nr:4-hydroxythreonine-4-phosphate dehydrogenase PdxA [Candidatus Omnitrophota bacterium]